LFILVLSIESVVQENIVEQIPRKELIVDSFDRGKGFGNVGRTDLDAYITERAVEYRTETNIAELPA